MVMNGPSSVEVAGARARWAGARKIAWLWGEHDLATADRLAEFLVAESADGDDLVVDLSAISFMDASTISVLVRARARMAEQSRVLTVRSPSTLMERVFGCCGLDDLIEEAEAPPLMRPERVRSALESWVAVAPVSRDPASSIHVQSASESAREASRD